MTDVLRCLEKCPVSRQELFKSFQMRSISYIVGRTAYILSLSTVVSQSQLSEIFMAILGKITWFISASSKRKNIMKSVMKDEGQVPLNLI